MIPFGVAKKPETFEKTEAQMPALNAQNLFAFGVSLYLLIVQCDNLTSVFGNFYPDFELKPDRMRRESKTETKASSSADTSGDDENLKLLDISGNSLTEEINLTIDAANEIEIKLNKEKIQP